MREQKKKTTKKRFRIVHQQNSSQLIEKLSAKQAMERDKIIIMNQRNARTSARIAVNKSAAARMLVIQITNQWIWSGDQSTNEHPHVRVRLYHTNNLLIHQHSQLIQKKKPAVRVLVIDWFKCQCKCKAATESWKFVLHR